MTDKFKTMVLNRGSFAVIHVKSKIDAETCAEVQKTIDKGADGDCCMFI